MITRITTHLRNHLGVYKRYKRFLWSAVVMLFLIFGAVQIFAAVTVTPANGWSNISADTAKTATSPAWTTLTGLTIAEGVHRDISTIGSIILQSPSGFEFNSGVTIFPIITRIVGSKDCFTGTMGTSTTNTITFNVSAIDVAGGNPQTYCSITFSGIQVRPTAWVPLANGNITSTWSATISWIVNNSTNLWTLIEITGAAKYMDILLPGQTFVPNSGHSGTASTQAWGVPFIMTWYVFDQFRNIVTSYTWNKTVTFTWPLSSAPTSGYFVNWIFTGILTPVGNGTYAITATGVGLSPISNSLTVITDTTPPSVTLIAPISGAYLSWNTFFTRTGADNVAISWYTFKVYNGATLIYSSWLTTTGISFNTGDGVYNRTVIATDTSNNTGTATNKWFIMDKTQPTFAGVTSGTTYTTWVAITFSDTNLSWATLNGAAYTNGTLITGNATYTFIVTDHAGNATGATFTVNIDYTLPSVTLIAPTSGAYLSWNTFFTRTGADNVAISWYTFKVYNGATLIYSSWLTTTGISFNTGDGVYNRTVIATDTSNNTGTATNKWFIMDKTKPAATIEYSPATPTSGNVVATLTGSTESITITNNGWSWLYIFTGNGAFTFEFKDAAGNTGSATATVNRIDTTKPTATVTYSPATATSGNVIATLTGFNKTGITITNNGWSGVYTFTNSGSFTFEFKDAVGNTWATTATVNRIDKTAPTATGAFSTTSLTNQDVTVTLTGWTETITGVNTYSHIFTGNGSFVFTFTDLVGNPGAYTATITRIDKTAPVVTVSGSSNMTVMIYGVYTEYGATRTDNVDGSGFISTPTSGSVNTGALGIYVLTYVKTDTAGNSWFAQRTVTVTGDVTPPTLAQVTPVPTPTNDNTPNYTFSSNEAGTISYSWSCSSATTSAISGNNTITFNTLADAIYSNCKIRVTDGASNPSSRLTVSAFTVDTAAPTATGRYVPAAATSGNVVATLTGFNEAITGQTPANITFTGNGSGTFTFYDLAGNTGTTIVSVNRIDKIAPAASVEYSPVSGTWTSGYVVATVTGWTEAITGLNTGYHVFVTNGTFTFTFYDMVRNPWSAVATVSRIDITPPTLAEITPVPAYTNDATPNYTFSSNETGTISYSGGCSSATASAISGNTTITFNTLADAIYSNCKIRVTDSVGNPSNRLTISAFTVDTIKPTATGTFSTTALTNQDVTARLTGRIETLTGVNTYSHTFTGNGSFTFTYSDLAGNTGATTVSVNRIDKTAPTATGTFSTTSPTNQDVTARLTGRTEAITGVNAYSHLFTGNGSFTFTYSDLAGNTGATTVSVTRIDTTPPTASVAYSITGSTNQDVTARLTGRTEAITGVNAYSHLFTGNGSFTFTYSDLAGNTGAATATVTWINKDIPTATVTYAPDTLTNGNVIATVTGFNKTGITITNNGGSPEYTFTGNGSFIFTFSDGIGNTGSATATVTWIDKIAPTLAQVTPVPALSNDTTPDYTFSSNEAGTISYSWDCSSVVTGATSGNTTITFAALSSGTHSNCKIRVTDNAGNPSNRLTVNTFVIDTAEPTAQIVYSITGITNQNVNATITGFSETVTGLNAVSHLFTGSGIFVFTFSDLVGNTGSATATVTWIDKENPVVTVNGSINMSVLQSGTYTELWATWTDNVDGSGVLVAPFSGSVDVYTLGSYILLYSYTDTAHNTGTAQRTVTVTGSAVPIININGANPYYIEYGSWYTEYGADRVDVTDGNGSVTNIVSTVDVNTLGTWYTVRYAYVNSLGITGTAIRNVTVRDTIAPTITLNGSGTISVEYESTYTELGATWSDIHDGNGSVSIISGSVNTSITGSYILTYLKADASGNTGSTTRTVIVQNPIPPVVSNVSSTVLSGTAAEIDFTTNIMAQGFVRYGIGVLSSLQAGTTNTTHAIILNGLTSNTTYSYRAFSRTSAYTGELSDTWTFTTPMLLRTDNIIGDVTVTGSATITNATSTGATFTTTGTLIITNGGNSLEIDLSWLTITASGTWNHLFLAPQEQTGVAEFGETGIPPQTESAITRVIIETIQAGGNVGLNANAGNHFRISFIVPTGTNGQILKLYRSEDGDTRTANAPDATCTLDAWLLCSFLTDTLSYFAAIKETTTTSSGTGGQGANAMSPDYCPKGDLSPSYYDGSCSAHGSAAVRSEENLDAYAYAYKLGFTKALSIETTKRFSSLTRYEFAKMAAIYAVKELGKKPDTKLACTFRDTKKSQRYYTTLACRLGLMGYTADGKRSPVFNPNKIVTRETSAAILSKLIYTDRKFANSAEKLQALKDDGIIANTKPSIKETRGTAMTMFERIGKQHAAAK